MDQVTRRTSQEIISHLQDWIKSLSQQSTELRTSTDAADFEQRFRDEGLEMLGSIFQKLLQNALNHQDENRACPKCGRRRRHKGSRQRGLISSVGAIRLSGTYWYCSDCGGQHAADTLVPESSSRPMQQLLCLLGTRQLLAQERISHGVSEIQASRVSDIKRADGEFLQAIRPTVKRPWDAMESGQCVVYGQYGKSLGKRRMGTTLENGRITATILTRTPAGGGGRLKFDSIGIVEYTLSGP